LPAVTVTIKPTIQINSVRVTSQILLVRALMYFVTVTPDTLKIIIENTPKITKVKRKPDDPID
jgi:hypothetical protein